MLEVLVALVLLALFLVPLAGAVDTAVERASRAWEQADTNAAPYDAPTVENWDWGPRVMRAEWRPGPVLNLSVETPRATIGVVGLWADGWFLGELTPADGGHVTVAASEVREWIGAELVIRVRAAEGQWGPPWRSVVPDSTGRLVSVEPRGHADAGECECSESILGAVHTPALANPLVTVSWLEGALEAQPIGAPFLLPRGEDGWGEVTVDASVQSWWMEEGRAIDIYY